MATYSWLTQTAAQDALLARLNAGALWTPAEAWVLLTEGLRHWNGLTEQWNETVAINNANGQWVNLGTLSSSPRVRTVTDQYLYGQMCSMLLEPQLSAGAWAGTSQFTLQNLQWALQKRCQETIQATSCNIAQLAPIDATPGVRNGYMLPDTALEARRNRYLALILTTTATADPGASMIAVDSAQGIVRGQVVQGAVFQDGTFVTGVSGAAVGLSLPTLGTFSGTVQFFQPFLLTREDVLSFQSFEPEYLQTVDYPQSWSVASEPPLSFDVDNAPNTSGYFELLALNTNPIFAPPGATLLGMPDDWSMVPMYGALADVLGMEAESTDRQRGAYCAQRYSEMLEMMKESNWLLQTLINGQVSKITALADMDALAVNWEGSTRSLPSVIVAGMDFVAPTPNSSLGWSLGLGYGQGGYGQGGYGGSTGNFTSQSLVLTVLGNAPLLDSTDTYVQISRDDWPAILDYAHHVATFKIGTKAFVSTMPMLQSFYRAAADRNKRWATYGPFVKYLRSEGRTQDEAEPREVQSAS